MLLWQKNLPTALPFPILDNSAHVQLQHIWSMVLTQLTLETAAGLTLTSTADGSKVEWERADTFWMFKECIDPQASVLHKAKGS